MKKVEEFSIFSSDPHLRNIVTGVVASRDVNVHFYRKVGEKFCAIWLESLLLIVLLNEKKKQLHLKVLKHIQPCFSST